MRSSKQVIPLIDLFAGPGGLCEGFCTDFQRTSDLRFQSVLSIEMEPHAHATLTLRSFYRQFDRGYVPDEYYMYLRGDLKRDELFRSYPSESQKARGIAWLAELGGRNVPNSSVDRRIRDALNGHDTWVLVGGPPCQAYSLAGRSRMRPGAGQEFDKDPRHFLYRQYLRILAVHKPPVFVLENVKGLLSSQVNGRNTFSMILNDLRQPGVSMADYTGQSGGKRLSYSVYPIARNSSDLFDDQPEDFIVRSESYGVPQARHRLILLGVRSDLDAVPRQLEATHEVIPSWSVLSGLPKLRSEISKRDIAWIDALESFAAQLRTHRVSVEAPVKDRIIAAIEGMRPRRRTGGRFVSGAISSNYLPEWFIDENLGGACNHSAKRHMLSDLHRYVFAACYAAEHNRSPVLRDFPEELLPKHRNIDRALKAGGGLFSDRFRVQVKGLPSTTITSHIAKDGHYYIHPDPVQCRSLTVREAARLQTFPDNYFFEGPQTAQYQQVGNAVPPLLAHAISEVVADLLIKSERLKNG